MILIPIKGFKTAKQRLASVLNAQERSSLARAMLKDVLRALINFPHSHPVSVITSDPEAQQVALQFGFGSLGDANASSETQAVAVATRVCLERGEHSVLVIPGDIPLVEPREIGAVLDALPAAVTGCVLVPAHDGRGTNAALLRPPGLLDLRFGDNSFGPHLRAAQETGQPWRVLRLPGIALDIDKPPDLVQLLQGPIRTESQKILRSWDVLERLRALGPDECQQARRMAP